MPLGWGSGVGGGGGGHGGGVGGEGGGTGIGVRAGVVLVVGPAEERVGAPVWRFGEEEAEGEGILTLVGRDWRGRGAERVGGVVGVGRGAAGTAEKTPPGGGGVLT